MASESHGGCVGVRVGFGVFVEREVGMLCVVFLVLVVASVQILLGISNDMLPHHVFALLIFF